MIRVGIVGLGFGAAVHLPAFLRIPDVRVVALAGRDAGKARAVATAHGIEHACDFETLLRTPLDAVSIALPPGPMAEVSERALAAGLAVLSEKPLADSAARAERLAHRAARAVTAVDFQFAEMDSFLALKRELARSVVSAVDIRWRTLSYAQKAKAWSWKTDRAAHGGVAALYGSHVLYLLEWLVGDLVEIAATYASDHTAAFTPGGCTPAEDTALILAKTSGGAAIRVELCSAAPDGHVHAWRIRTPAASYALEAAGASVLGALRLVKEQGGAREIVAQDTAAQDEDARVQPFLRLARRFINATGTREPCRPDFGAGARVQRLLETAAQSAAQGGKPIRCAAQKS
jgi:predicted dehydrogenase